MERSQTEDMANPSETHAQRSGQDVKGEEGERKSKDCEQLPRAVSDRNYPEEVREDATARPCLQ